MGKTTNMPLKWMPSAAGGASLVPGNAAWVYSGWVTITTGRATPTYLLATAILPNNGATQVSEANVQVQLGIGASGSEVIVVTHRARFKLGVWAPRGTMSLGTMIGPIGSGIRIAARVTHSLTGDTDPYIVAVGFYEGPGSAGYLSTSYPPTVDPIDNATTTLTGATWPTWGAWSEMLSAAEVPANIYIYGIVLVGGPSSSEVQIGTGAASSEVAIATIAYTTDSGGNGVSYTKLPHPIRIAAGTRITMRTRGIASTSPTGYIWYGPRP